MADAYLANQVVVTTSGVEKSVTYEAGSLITDSDVQSAIVAAGGILLPATEAVVAMAAHVASQINFTPQTASLMMLAAGLGATDTFVKSVAVTQDTWWIKPSVGDDSNDGLTEGTALATYAGFYSKIASNGPPTISFPITVHLPEGLPTDGSDNLKFDIKFEGTGGLTFVLGVKETLLTGTFTDVTALDPTTNQAFEVEDTALESADTWGTVLKKRIRITAGPRAGLVARVFKDLGTKRAITSNWISPTFPPDPWFFIDTGIPQVGDAYVVEELLEVRPGAMSARIGDSDISFLPPSVNFVLGKFTTTVDEGVMKPDFQGPEFRMFECECDVDFDFTNCQNAISVGTAFGKFLISLNSGGWLTAAGGMCSNGVYLEAGTFSPTGHFMSKGTINVRGPAALCDGSTFGIVDGSMHAYQGGVFKVSAGDFGQGALWGSGSDFYGVMVSTGSTGLLSGLNGPNNIYLTGSLGDFAVGGDVFSAGAKALAVDESGSPAVLSDPITTSWTNFNAAVADGGFGQAACRPQYGAILALDID